MSDVTRILSAIEAGDAHAAERLSPLVYDELRKLAAAKLARENPGQTLQATALVHEAHLRLLGNAQHEPSWDNRGHSFAAAAESSKVSPARIISTLLRPNIRTWSIFCFGVVKGMKMAPLIFK